MKVTDGDREKLYNEFEKLMVYYACFPPVERIYILLIENEKGELSVSPTLTLFPEAQIIDTIHGEPDADSWDLVDWGSEDVEEISGLKREEALANGKEWFKEKYAKEFERWAINGARICLDGMAKKFIDLALSSRERAEREREQLKDYLRL